MEYETKFMHFVLGKGRVTVAIKRNDTHAQLAASFCSPNDQFARKKGRLIAEGRLSKGKVLHQFALSPGRNLEEQVFDFFKQAQELKIEQLPQWAK